MEAQVNAPGSKLVRVDYTSNGSYTYTVPAEGLVALGYFLTGGGGKGGDAYASRWAGTGGSGAEAVYGCELPGQLKSDLTLWKQCSL